MRPAVAPVPLFIFARALCKGRNLPQLFVESMHSFPCVVIGLHREPDARPVPDEFADARCHVGTDTDAPYRDAVQSLPADAEQSCDFTNTALTPKLRHHLFAENDAGMNRLARRDLVSIDGIFVNHFAIRLCRE